MKSLSWIIDTIVNLITSIVLLVIKGLSRLPFLGEEEAIIVTLAIFLFILLTCLYFFIFFLHKKKYGISFTFLLSILLVALYFVILSHNIGHKAN